jgi:hypothetical protein
MFDYDDYEGYYEPTAYDEIMNEAIDKIKETVKEDVKQHFKNIQTKNEILKKQNEALKEKEYEISNLRNELEVEKQKLERTFYRKKWSEILQDMVVEGYEIYCDYVAMPKCNKCDDERKITYASPYGSTTKCSCDCNKSIPVYKSTSINIAEIEIGKDWSEKVWMHPRYHSGRDEDRYITIKFSQFKESFIEPKNDTYYGYYYLSKEECQKHCDYLNNKREEATDETI